jgi:hypothetical protein
MVRDSRADRVEERLAIPVVIAAAVSVPAVFMTIVGDTRTALVGTLLNWASLGVLTAESVLLFLLTGHRLAWLRRHRWTVVILAVAIPAVALTLAPVQVLRVALRLIQFFGAVRVLRAGRIIRAGAVLARRVGGDGRWRHVPIMIGSVVAAVFVVLVLADPTSTARVLLTERGPLPVLLAGGILAAATFIVLRYRRRAAQPTDPPADDT